MRILALAATAVLIAACGFPAAGTMVDGWDLGARIVCDEDECAETIAVATLGLDLDAPDHPPIVEVAVYDRAAVVAHQPTTVVVFRLLDGSTRAIGVGSVGLGGPVPWDAPDHPLIPGGLPPDASALTVGAAGVSVTTPPR